MIAELTNRTFRIRATGFGPFARHQIVSEQELLDDGRNIERLLAWLSIEEVSKDTASE